MKKFRVENDIDVFIQVFRDGVPDQELSSRNLKLCLKTKFKVVKLEKFTIVGSVIKVSLKGTQLKTPGIYYFTLYDVKENLSLLSTDSEYAFELVPFLPSTEGTDPTVGFKSTLTDIEMKFLTSGGVIDYNLLKNKPSINGKVLQGDLSLEDLGISIEVLASNLVSKQEFNATIIDLKRSLDSKEKFLILSLRKRLFRSLTL